MAKKIVGPDKPVGGANASDEKKNKKRGRPRKVEVVKKRGRKHRVKPLVDTEAVAEGKRKVGVLITNIRKSLDQTEKTLSKVFPEEDSYALNSECSGLIFKLECALGSLKEAHDDYVMNSGRLYGRSKVRKDDDDSED